MEYLFAHFGDAASDEKVTAWLNEKADDGWRVEAFNVAGANIQHFLLSRRKKA